MPQFLLTPDLKVASGKWGEYTKAVSCLLSPSPTNKLFAANPT
ncbi:hypothetical protein MICAH_760005 [Microcystis aeruginosa PCC 9809]|uniref:Uncharacterized protein n=2 Tax=Microcystis aeruginosa TaxID=1126 RepID=I4I6Y4_MICAE|nr:hypothetical protein MICAB_2330003 [Microcystis aeruginosa PCC 9717]CCI30058.1 hypothetical protein MICAH_760005 [Microcystis aeruginosa PCC 9809]